MSGVRHLRTLRYRVKMGNQPKKEIHGEKKPSQVASGGGEEVARKILSKGNKTEDERNLAEKDLFLLTRAIAHQTL